jgi:phage gp29-like protein
MKIIKKACDGDLRAASELLDRIEGKATQVNVNANSEMSHDDLIALVEKANDAK